MDEFINIALTDIIVLLQVKVKKNAKIHPDDMALFTLLASCLNTTPKTIQILEGLPSADRVLERIGEQLSSRELVSLVNQLLRKLALSGPLLSQHQSPVGGGFYRQTILWGS